MGLFAGKDGPFQTGQFYDFHFAISTQQDVLKLHIPVDWHQNTLG